jgi:hypothetical protein
MDRKFELPAERAIPDSRATARRRLLERNATLSAERRQGTQFRRRFAVTVVGVPVLILSGAAMAYVSLKPASVPVQQQTRCYTQASLAGGNDFYGTTVGQATPSLGQTRNQAAVDICASLWQQGFLHLGSKQISAPTDGPSNSEEVPDLVACTLDNGVAAVFPGDNGTCVRLGLPRLDE